MSNLYTTKRPGDILRLPFDLTALRVDMTTANNSETGLEED